MLVFAISGPPGAGKGTQGDLLCKNPSLNMKKVSTGEILKKHIKMQSELGKQVEQTIAAGNLVSDDTVIALVEAEYAEWLKGSSNILLDGFPRTLSQAEALTKIAGDHLRLLINLDVKSEVLIERISGRRTCESCFASYHIKHNPAKVAGVCDQCGSNLFVRPDDGEAEVKNRLNVYEKQTAPIVNYYNTLGVLKQVDGNRQVEVVVDDLVRIVEKELISQR